MKKVVKVVSMPKNIDLIDMLKEEGVVEENQTVELEDPDDFGALESINDESIDCKLIASYLLFRITLFSYWTSMIGIHD